MKIEIDLNDILGDENGAETLEESVRRQVIDSVSKTVKKGVGDKINAAVNETITKAIDEYLSREMPVLLAGIMDAEYQVVDRWGDRKGKPTSFRQELINNINENMVYKLARYDSDKNPFTRAVDEVIGENLKSFKAEFQKQVDSQFTAAAMQYAQETLKKKLGIV